MKMSMIAKELEGVAEAVRDAEVDIEQKLRKVADYVGIKTIEHLRDFINETRPPIRPGEPARKARRGHWADQSGNLARAYRHEVEVTNNGVVLVLMNSMEYAAVLDVREGFFVLRGVADKGGPVEMMLRRAIEVIAPDWELRYE
jgi:hypothetical protein